MLTCSRALNMGIDKLKINKILNYSHWTNNGTYCSTLWDLLLYIPPIKCQSILGSLCQPTMENPITK